MTTIQEMKKAFIDAGVCKGDVVLLQSALRPIGYAENGAEGVVDALLEVLGEEGTLVCPAFSFTHERQDCPIIDPKNDPSEMGIISETLRKRKGTKRSIAYRHSFSAYGKYADEITNVDHELSVFDLRSSFGKLLGLDAKILLLGVHYHNSTSHHFAEYVLQVPDREVIVKKAKLKTETGELKDIVVRDYQPKKNDSGAYYAFPHDFNRTGLILEQQGLVKIHHVGNAMTRVFKMRDLIHYLVDNYGVEYNLFAELPGKGQTILPDGEEVIMQYKDCAGRTCNAVWSCVSADAMYKVDGKNPPIRILKN